MTVISKVADYTPRQVTFKSVKLAPNTTLSIQCEELDLVKKVVVRVELRDGSDYSCIPLCLDGGDVCAIPQTFFLKNRTCSLTLLQ